MQLFDQHIIGPFSEKDIIGFRGAVEQAGRDGFELVGITSAGRNLYAAVKRPVQRTYMGADGQVRPLSMFEE